MELVAGLGDEKVKLRLCFLCLVETGGTWWRKYNLSGIGEEVYTQEREDKTIKTVPARELHSMVPPNSPLKSMLSCLRVCSSLWIKESREPPQCSAQYWG